ncbi:MAG TPA: hypothetical protein VKP14_07630 [Gaiellaceae bacterium]|nr:hypothetical protein [Gaiellaceae bacterium]
MKKIGAAAAMAAMTIVAAALCGVALADEGHQGAKPAKPAPPPQAASHDSSKDQNTPAKPESASKPSEPEAKVYICHATGSQSNPYVLIHVSSHALPAHTSHQDGRDIVLGASPGTCPGASTTSNVQGGAEQSQGEQHAAGVQGAENTKPENAKVFICHATGSDSNPYVLIHVSEHAVPAHTRHQDGRDIVLGAAPGACPGASTTSNVQAADHSEAAAQMISFCDMETATTGKLETKPADKVVSHELNGTPEEARDIVPTFTFNGQTYSQNFDANGQAIVAAQCNEAAPAEVQGVQETSCTSDDNDQSDHEKAKQHDDNGSGDDKNGQDRDQKAFASHHEDNDNEGNDNEGNDNEDNCPAAASTSNTSSASSLSAVSASSNTSVSLNTSSSSNTSSSTSSNTASASNTASTPASTASTPSSNAQSAGVLGTTKALTSPAAPVLSAKPSAGVLGTVAKISSAATSGTLPFSGIRLWIVELVALGLIGLGVATRMVVRRRPN